MSGEWWPKLIRLLSVEVVSLLMFFVIVIIILMNHIVIYHKASLETSWLRACNSNIACHNYEFWCSYCIISYFEYNFNFFYILIINNYVISFYNHPGKLGHFVGSVDENSPAQLGGLKENDRILEVDHQDVTSKLHKAVVDLIRAGKNSVDLLVVDPETENYFTQKGIVLPSKLPFVLECKGPLTNPRGRKGD